MKKYFVLLAIILLLFPLAAQEGSMAGSGKLRVSQTKYFDIIYSQKNLATADILYHNADAVFEELAAAYGIDPYFRLPVVITTSVVFLLLLILFTCLTWISTLWKAYCFIR